MQKRSEVRGVMLGHATSEEREEIINAINQGLADGSLDPIVSSSYSLSSAFQSHIDVVSPDKVSVGKLVICPWE